MILKLHDTLNPSRLVIVVANEILVFPSRGPSGNASVQTAVGLIGVAESEEEIWQQVEAQKP